VEESGGQLNCYLIVYAYQLDSFRVSGAKCGLTCALEATFDPSATDEQIRLMAQALLLDRFRMRSHRVTTEANGYALTIGKGGLKVKKVEVGDKPPPMPEGDKDASPALRAETYIAATVPQAGVIAITGRRVSISQLAEILQRSTSIPVWDRTGLSGNYYFAFRYAQGLTTELQPNAPSLATALQENLGLKLEKRKGRLRRW
jgi:uncharacterized protein (TIGR03435 family)